MTLFQQMFAAIRAIIPQDEKEFLVDETARLAEECARQLSYRSAHKKGSLDKDIRKVFSPRPKRMLPIANQMGSHGMRWLSAGINELQGVKEYRYHDTDTAADMARLFYKSKLPEERRKDLGIHGHSGKWNFRENKAYGIQRVYELQRIVVRRGVYQEFRRDLQARYGRLEASFALTAKKLRGSGAKVKAYISRHLNGEALPNITDLSRLGLKGNPSISFGSFAPGVEGFEYEIQRAVDFRVDKMERRHALILNDYVKDVNASRVPRRASGRIGGIE